MLQTQLDGSQYAKVDGSQYAKVDGSQYAKVDGDWSANSASSIGRQTSKVVDSSTDWHKQGAVQVGVRASSSEPL